MNIEHAKEGTETEALIKTLHIEKTLIRMTLFVARTLEFTIRMSDWPD